jgi:hypothetical protein
MRICPFFEILCTCWKRKMQVLRLRSAQSARRTSLRMTAFFIYRRYAQKMKGFGEIFCDFSLPRNAQKSPSAPWRRPRGLDSSANR